MTAVKVIAGLALLLGGGYAIKKWREGKEEEEEEEELDEEKPDEKAGEGTRAVTPPTPARLTIAQLPDSVRAKAQAACTTVKLGVVPPEFDDIWTTLKTMGYTDAAYELFMCKPKDAVLCPTQSERTAMIVELERRVFKPEADVLMWVGVFEQDAKKYAAAGCAGTDEFVAAIAKARASLKGGISKDPVDLAKWKLVECERLALSLPGFWKCDACKSESKTSSPQEMLLQMLVRVREAGMFAGFSAAGVKKAQAWIGRDWKEYDRAELESKPHELVNVCLGELVYALTQSGGKVAGVAEAPAEVPAVGKQHEALPQLWSRRRGLRYF